MVEKSIEFSFNWVACAISKLEWSCGVSCAILKLGKSSGTGLAAARGTRATRIKRKYMLNDMEMGRSLPSF